MVSYLIPIHNRAFIDTNVVWYWHTYGDQIAENMDFDEKQIIAKYGTKALEDIHGISCLYQVASNEGSIEFVVTENVLRELLSKAHNLRGFGRYKWGAELLTYWAEQSADYAEFEDFTTSHERARTWLNYGVLDFLPDSADRLLIAAAFASHCGIFLTMDYKTILPFRKRIKQLTKMTVLRPSEYAQEVC